MFIPGKFYKDEQKDEQKVFKESKHPKYEFLINKTKVVNEKEVGGIKWDDLEFNYSQENRFFKGLLLALPISLGLWATIIYVIKLIIDF